MAEKQLTFGDTGNLSPALYLISTPIGNLRDITLRALDILSSCDLIACEDKRISTKLLNAYNMKGTLTTYHDHSDEKSRNSILKRISEGQSVALISDAGTPLVSDPGYKLVQDAVSSGLPVIPVPGANAVLPALQLSALPSDKFAFCGFIPTKKGERDSFLSDLADLPMSLVFYENAKRLNKTIPAMIEILGNRDAAIVREISKMFEETLRGKLSDLVNQCDGLKGEIVLVVDGDPQESVDDETLKDMLRDALQNQSLKSAVDDVSAQSRTSRKHVYSLALALRDEIHDELNAQYPRNG